MSPHDSRVLPLAAARVAAPRTGRGDVQTFVALRCVVMQGPWEAPYTLLLLLLLQGIYNLTIMNRLFTLISTHIFITRLSPRPI